MVIGSYCILSVNSNHYAIKATYRQVIYVISKYMYNEVVVSAVQVSEWSVMDLCVRSIDCFPSFYVFFLLSLELFRECAVFFCWVWNCSESVRFSSVEFGTVPRVYGFFLLSLELFRECTLTVPNSTEKKNVEKGETIDTPNTQIHDRPLTSLVWYKNFNKKCGVKLVLLLIWLIIYSVEGKASKEHNRGIV
jgi:hypothetical protein